MIEIRVKPKTMKNEFLSMRTSASRAFYVHPIRLQR